MSEIKITWGGDSIELPLSEAEGFAESLEADGETFTWEDLRVSPTSPTTPPVNPFDGNERERQFVAAPHQGPDVLAQKSAARNLAAAAQAELKTQSEAHEVPVWVLRVRRGLQRARTRGNVRHGVIRQRQDGSWLWFDENGRMEDLPRDAGNWFTHGQTSIAL